MAHNICHLSLVGLFFWVLACILKNFCLFLDLATKQCDPIY